MFSIKNEENNIIRFVSNQNYFLLPNERLFSLVNPRKAPVSMRNIWFWGNDIDCRFTHSSNVESFSTWSGLSIKLVVFNDEQFFKGSIFLKLIRLAVTCCKFGNSSNKICGNVWIFEPKLNVTAVTCTFRFPAKCLPETPTAMSPSFKVIAWTSQVYPAVSELEYIHSIHISSDWIHKMFKLLIRAIAKILKFDCKCC